MTPKGKIKKAIKDSIKTKEKLSGARFVDIINNISAEVVNCLKRSNKVLVAGNGGSAADANHFAAELSGKFENPKRQSLSALSLVANPSVITAIGNDFGFDQIFSRQIEGLGRKGDVFVAISTSGNSANLVKALRTCRRLGLFAIGLLGRNGGKMKSLCDLVLVVPSATTARVQEAHLLIYHLICQAVDTAFSQSPKRF